LRGKLVGAVSRQPLFGLGLCQAVRWIALQARQEGLRRLRVERSSGRLTRRSSHTAPNYRSALRFSPAPRSASSSSSAAANSS
jgi:hypothetical protein